MADSVEQIDNWVVESDLYRELVGDEEDDIETAVSSHTPSGKQQNSSPVKKSPQKSVERRLRRSRNNQDDDHERSYRPSYRREKDGLSPLRSPLTSEPRASRLNLGSRTSPRRRSWRDDKGYQKETDTSKSLSPTKKNRISYTTTSPSRSRNYSMDSEDGTPVVSKSLYQDRKNSSRHRFRRRLDLPSEKDSVSDENPLLNPEIEEDKIILARREKQISYGKITESYKQYIATIPKEERGEDRKKHPRTPIKCRKCSRRNWDAQIKAWKKYLHEWANVNDDILDLNAPSETSDQKSVEEAGGGASSQDEEQAAEEQEELDLNADNDDSFLEGFELQYDALNKNMNAAEFFSLS